MGKEKYQKKILELFKKSPVVSSSSIKRMINSTNSDTRGEYFKQLIRNLLKKNIIFKLGKGYYSRYSDPIHFVFTVNPSYLGLQDSLSKHGLIEQETIPIIITTRKIRQGIRKVNNSNILIRKIDKKYLFGIDYLQEGEFYFPYSDIEKTFIDMIYFNENISSESLKEIKKKIDKNRLHDYLKKYPKKFQKKILLILSEGKNIMDFAGIFKDDPEWLNIMERIEKDRRNVKLRTFKF